MHLYHRNHSSIRNKHKRIELKKSVKKRKKENHNDLVFQAITIEVVTQKCSLK